MTSRAAQPQDCYRLTLRPDIAHHDFADGDLLQDDRRDQYEPVRGFHPRREVAGRGLMPICRASSLERTTKLAPVSTIILRRVPLTIGSTKKCPCGSAAIEIGSIGAGRARPFALASNSALVSPRRGIRSAFSWALVASQYFGASASARMIRKRYRNKVYRSHEALPAATLISRTKAQARRTIDSKTTTILSRLLLKITLIPESFRNLLGGGVLRRDAGRGVGASRQAGDLQYRPGLAVHGPAFTGVLAGNGIAISMDGKGAWRDNVFVERLWRSVKYEEVYLRAYDSVSEARTSIGRYLDFYNGRRPHSSLDGTHPIKPTSPRCPSAWQPNPGRGSTYRSGNSVQTTGTTTDGETHELEGHLLLAKYFCHWPYWNACYRAATDIVRQRRA